MLVVQGQKEELIKMMKIVASPGTSKLASFLGQLWIMDTAVRIDNQIKLISFRGYLIKKIWYNL